MIVKLCTDCGTNFRHQDGGTFCRRCCEQGGEPGAFYTKIDHDKLRARLGAKLAGEILRTCKQDE